jgi:hypothetical protein
MQIPIVFSSLSRNFTADCDSIASFHIHPAIFPPLLEFPLSTNSFLDEFFSFFSSFNAFSWKDELQL